MKRLLVALCTCVVLFVFASAIVAFLMGLALMLGGSPS